MGIEGRTHRMENGDGQDAHKEAQNAKKELRPKTEAKGESQEEKKEKLNPEKKAEKKERLEDYSYKELMKMLDTPEGLKKVKELNNDFRERYEAELRGMTADEYRDYKAAREGAGESAQEKAENREAEKKEEAKPEAKAEQMAAEALEAAKDVNVRTKDARLGGAGKQKLGDLSNENTYAINKLKEAQAEAAKEKDAVYKEIHTINIQEKKDEDPKGYARLCERYYALESLEHKLDVAKTDLDMNNYDISMQTGREFKSEAGGRIDEKRVEKAFDRAEELLSQVKEDTGDMKRVVNAHRLSKEFANDVIPGLDGKRRECETLIQAAGMKQEQYLKEHGLTPEQARKEPDGIYARNEAYIDRLKNEAKHYDEQLCKAIETQTALSDGLPAGENCWMQVTENKDGTLRIVRTWGSSPESHEKEGKWHDSEVSCRQDAVSKKDVLVIGRTDGAVHSHEFSCSYRGRELERRDTFKLGQTKIENVANFSFLASGYGYKYARGEEGKFAKFSANANFSLLKVSDAVSVIRNSKAYQIFSAEVAALSAKADVKMDDKGFITGSLKASRLDASAALGAGNIKAAEFSASSGKMDLAASSLDILKNLEGGEKKREDPEKKMETPGSANMDWNLAKDLADDAHTVREVQEEGIQSQGEEVENDLSYPAVKLDESDRSLEGTMKKIYDKYFCESEKIRKRGAFYAKMTQAKKEAMLQEMKAAYYAMPAEKRGGVFLPQTVDYFEDHTIVRRLKPSGGYEDALEFEPQQMKGV